MYGPIWIVHYLRLILRAPCPLDVGYRHSLRHRTSTAASTCTAIIVIVIMNAPAATAAVVRVGGRLVLCRGPRERAVTAT